MNCKRLHINRYLNYTSCSWSTTESSEGEGRGVCVCVSQWLHIRDRPIDSYKNYKNPHTPHSTMVHISVGTRGFRFQKVVQMVFGPIDL